MQTRVNSVTRSEKEENGRKRNRVDEVEDLGDCAVTGSLTCDYGKCEDASFKKGFIFSNYVQQERHLQQSSPCPEGLRYTAFSPPIDESLEEIKKHGEIFTGIQDFVKPNTENKWHRFSLASFELLKRKGSGFKRLIQDLDIESRRQPERDQDNRLSSVEIMKIAAERFIQFFSGDVHTMSPLSNPFDISFSGLSSEEIEDVDVVVSLLIAAEKVNNQDTERATQLLCQCDLLSFNTGNPIQRIVYYFSEALSEKLHRESKGLVKKLPCDTGKFVSHGPDQVQYYQQVPFTQITQFAGIQAIVENVAKARRIHIIDLSIRSGVQWTTLIQALACRPEKPVVLLKITAIGSASTEMNKTSEWLVSFANTMNIPFSFKAMTISDMIDLKDGRFELDYEEKVVVYSMCFLWTMIPVPEKLHSLMEVISNLNPSLMVVVEVESNHNSPYFMTRFVEAIFYFGAYFDCFDDCFQRDDLQKIAIESSFSAGIKNIVAADGEARTVRHVTVDIWREFFSHFGMEEEDLSRSSLYQADLMLKHFPHGSSCSLDMNGKCLILGWKGTPIHSLSVWKFKLL